MSKLLTACALALALVSVPAARAKDEQPAKKDALEALLAALDAEVQLPEGQNVNELPLYELLQDFSKRYGIGFVMKEDTFEAGTNIKEKKPNLAVTQLRGMTMREFLNLTLKSMNATFLLRRNHIEIVSVEQAAKETKAQFTRTEETAALKYPLISTVIKEKPLNEAVAKLAEIYDLNVQILPQAGDARTAFVSARMLNVPAEKALELLALQSELRVVKKGNAFLLTTKDHAEGLNNEKQDRERQMIELELLRKGTQPKPPEAPEPKPQPKQ